MNVVIRVALALLVPGVAAAQEGDYVEEVDGPQRSGFTVEAGIGVANTAVISDFGNDYGNFGIAGLSVGLGFFATSDLALLARATGTSFFRESRGDEIDQLTNGFYGAVAQYWITDRLSIAAGPGLAVYAVREDIESEDDDDGRSVTGFGVSLRAGYALGLWHHHALRIGAEILPSFYDGGRVVGSGLTFEWQLL